MQNFKPINTSIKTVIVTVCLILSCTLSTTISFATPFLAIAYHDVVDERGQLDSDSITLETLVNHFEWLHANGYNPISIDDLLLAKKGVNKLPPKPILLCWDDGYTSFYTHVYPLLKAYKYPAVLALMGEWMQVKSDAKVMYGDTPVDRDRFLSWHQVTEMASSGLVEIASHSMNLHRGLLAAESGDQLPATITHRFDKTTNSYESDNAMSKRIYLDLKASSDLIFNNSGILPRVMVWPYGRYNDLAIKASKKAGMPITLTLDPVPANSDYLDAVPRIYPTLNPETGAFNDALKFKKRPPRHTFARFQTEDLVDTDLKNEPKLSMFLERTKDLAPSMVTFSPTIEKNDKTYTFFRNERFPILQDRLLRLTWHTNRRGGVEVHLWLNEGLFNISESENREQLSAFFSELGKSSPGSGIILDYPKFAKEMFSQVENQHLKTSSIVGNWNPQQGRINRQQLLDSSNNEVISNTIGAIENIQKWQPLLEIGLLVSEEMLINATPETIASILSYTDYLLLDLREEFSPSLKHWLQSEEISPYASFFTAMLRHEPKSKRNTIVKNIENLEKSGIISYGYEYDDFANNTPQLDVIRPAISNRIYPFIPK